MSIIRDIIYGSVSRGADFHKLCEEIGVTPEELNNSEHASFEVAATVWNVTLEHTGDPLLGLHLGQTMNPSIVGMTGYLMQNCSTFYESLALLCKFNEVYSTMMKFAFVSEGKDTSFVSFEPIFLWLEKYLESARQSIEFSMSGILSLFSIMTGTGISPVKIEFAFPRRRHEAYEKYFNCPVVFNANRSAIHFDNRSLAIRINAHDKALFAFFNDTLQKKLHAMKSQSKISERIRQLVIANFKGVVPPIEIAASTLNLSTRSLQRKLKDEEQTSYRELANEIKKEFSLSMMDNADMRVKDVAFLLGYSDSSAFKKAYNKWISKP